MLFSLSPSRTKSLFQFTRTCVREDEGVTQRGLDIDKFQFTRTCVREERRPNNGLGESYFNSRARACAKRIFSWQCFNSRAPGCAKVNEAFWCQTAAPHWMGCTPILRMVGFNSRVPGCANSDPEKQYDVFNSRAHAYARPDRWAGAPSILISIHAHRRARRARS